MIVAEFDKLKQDDFQNGAIRDEIRTALRQREKLITLLIDWADGRSSQDTFWHNALGLLEEIEYVHSP